MVEPAFALLFSVHRKSGFNGFGSLPRVIAPLPPEQGGGYVARLAELEMRLLGKTFLGSERLAPTPLGHVTIELLLIERAVLACLYQRLSSHMPSSVDELLTLKQEILDALGVVLAWTMGASVVTGLALLLLRGKVE